MARRSIEMYEYRQALMRMRQGDSARDCARETDGTGEGGPFPRVGRGPRLARSGAAGAGGCRDRRGDRPSATADERAVVDCRVPAPGRAMARAGVSGVVIHATLKREHGFAGHYSSVRRLIAGIERERPPEATVRCRSRRQMRHRSISAPVRNSSIRPPESCAARGPS